ncbi:MAG: 4'-phosphopantetheinyl transferase family protein, partial [Bilophila wadsworthia]
SRPLTGPTQSGFRDLLSEEECAAASRFHTPELAERYRQAHGWMRSVLSRYLDTPPETLRFRSGPDGKPRLAHGSLHFNLAHSDSLALLAVRQDAPVGVDVEPVRPLPEDAHRLPLVLGPEIRWIAASDDRDRAFLRCWFCREAFLKATGRPGGLWTASRSTHAANAPSGRAALAECTPLAGHVAAVACETLFPSC